ncbi:hypothetical protein UFOVP581_45 [uncultured Caudovirales phage]|uniref:PD-(D/E)XK endonuclease-like domain-containing protein n=1 Tax=uncultured Caudovirales phage TaxID=2100421 RepID=A0A6J5PND9_9CAUD|nr:hypothetical protein UFOVP581_45 [uncultured Caudovirales phage]
MKPVFRCSSLHPLLTKPRDKTSAISKTAESELKRLLKAELFDYEQQLDSKYLNKGIQCENDSLALYNLVTGKKAVKNSERFTIEFDHFFLTGEPDIISPSTVTDLKTAWSLDTFPCFPDDASKPEYESQVQGYIFLLNQSNKTDIDYDGEIAYCMVDTPDELCKWENPKAHKVDHIAPEFRLTLSRFERSADWEANLVEQLNKCGQVYANLRNEFLEVRGLK